MKPDRKILVCALAIGEPPIPSGIELCADCDVEVFVSPASREYAGDADALCEDCAIKAMEEMKQMGEEIVVAPLNFGQLREMLKHYKL